MRNKIDGSVPGRAIQVGTINGSLTVTDQGDRSLHDPLIHTSVQLAQTVTGRWRREEERRQIQDPFPLPVAWRSVPERLMDQWANIHGAPSGVDPGPLDLRGRLDEVADVYRRIPSKRLIVLGRAGSGKTVLSLRLVLDLLKIRSSTDPVPVIFGIGSWNPAITSLRDWLTARLIRDYPGLAATGAGGSTLAANLVDAHRILPILDGFDEIATGLHRAALNALNATTLPLVMTSRSTEYRKAVAQTRPLAKAAAIELTDLTMTDVANYLPRTARKTSNTSTTMWDSVLTSLRVDPESRASSTLTAVLTTPLMIMLVRTVYGAVPDRNPSALLNADRFPTPEAVEDHLLAEFVPTVYWSLPDNRPAHRHRYHEPDRVQRWLGYLAWHLDQLGTHDLAWWQLGNTMRSWSRALITGLVVWGAVGAAVGAIVGVWAALHGRLAVGLANFLPSFLLIGPVAGVAFGLVHWLNLTLVGAFEPSRVQLKIFGRTSRVHKRIFPRLMTGLGVGLAWGFVSEFIVWLARGLLEGGPTGWLRYAFDDGLQRGLAAGPSVGVVLVLVAWFEAPLDIESAVSPTDLLNVNRRTALSQLLVFGPMFGIAVTLIGAIVHQVINSVMGPVPYGQTLLYGITAGVGGGLGLALSMTAWGQWVVFARIWLPLTGRLPWTVNAFLCDAYERGVLRQAGAVYQFRHARLRDHLARVSNSK